MRHALPSRIVFLFILFTILLGGADRGHAQPPFVVETIDPGGFVGINISLAVDDDGNPHVVYWDVTNFWLVYAVRIDGTWNSEIIEANAFSGAETDIAVDAQGVPHVSSHHYTATGEELHYAHRTGGSWTTENVEVTVNNVGRYNAIAIDAQGRPHIVYQDVTATDLKYAVKDGAWSIETPYATGEGYYNDLALDASGHPHVSSIDDEPDLWYARKTSTTWSREMISGTVDMDPTAIDLDPTGDATVVFNFGIDVFYVSRDGTTWTSAPVANAATFAGAFAFDRDGRIEVAYRNTAGGRNDLWRFGFVDPALVNTPIVETGTLNDIGTDADMARDPHGNTVVAYYDASRGDALLADSGVWLATSLAGATWPVGSERTVGWRGSGAVDILLSTDGGASYETIATGLTDATSGGSHTFTVPHTPSRFCKIRVRRMSPYAESDSDSLFTIETSVSLLNFVVTLPQGGGVDLAWQTDPGPADLSGYRLDRQRGAAWSTVAALTQSTSYHDADGQAGDRYRLFAVNGLGEELLLTTGAAGPPKLSALDLYPNPFGSSDLNVSFATGSGLGGSDGRVTISVYDVAGRRVATLVEESMPAGFHQTTWNGRDARGQLVPSGVYFVKAETAGSVTTRKLTIVR